MNSSNSNRLRELGVRANIESYLIDSADDICDEWLEGKIKIGVTAGASAPEILVQSVIEYLKVHGASNITECQGRKETITFAIPKALRNKNEAL